MRLIRCATGIFPHAPGLGVPASEQFPLDLRAGMAIKSPMARPLRFQYPGAIYHVMARSDGGKAIFETDDDRLVFLKRLEETCGSCGWRVHA